jgi:hypothetical protein
MGKIEIDAMGKVSGWETIKKNGKVEFDADLHGKKACIVEVTFVAWDPPDPPIQGITAAAARGTIKIGS